MIISGLTILNYTGTYGNPRGKNVEQFILAVDELIFGVAESDIDNEDGEGCQHSLWRHSYFTINDVWFQKKQGEWNKTNEIHAWFKSPVRFQKSSCSILMRERTMSQQTFILLETDSKIGPVN